MDEKTKVAFGPQESFCYRALTQARQLAEQLIDEKGQLRQTITTRNPPLDEEGYSDDAIRDHHHRFLKRWHADLPFVQKFRRFSLPLCHAFAEEVIRWTLDLPPQTKLQDFHIKRAAAAACLTPLRQSIGSCFATAPAIEIQQFHLDLFVDDLYELLSRGRLTRVVDGVEYAAPFCHSVGQKTFVNNALLKIWEFTLASYCDIKMEFSKWSLGWCVGLPPQEPGGIGSVLHRALEEKLHEAHVALEKSYKDAVIALEQLRSAEALAHRAGSAEELRRIKAEGIGKAHHLQVCQDLYKEAQEKEKSTAGILPFFIEQYTALFQHAFQEIYDPEFTDETTDVYEDRQAGFRLVYKHGRSDSSLWTPIHSREEFIASLDDFFRAAETPLAHLCKEPYEKALVSEITTVILHHLQTSTFVDSCLARAKKRNRLPWAYSAGGSVEQIASLYFRKSTPPKFEQRLIQDELDLFTFIIETMKALPPAMTNQFAQDKERSLLFQSPTHVCLLLPGMPTFFEAWNDRGFTYTWIRDEWIAPARQFYLDQKLSRDEQKELYRRLGVEGELKSSMTLEEFSKQAKRIPMDILGAFLFQTLPLIPAEQCQALLQSTKIQLPPFLSSEELFRLMYKSSEETSADAVRETMRELKLAPPVFLFADTNWPCGYFSFVIHPITLKLEVWKTDRAGVTGAPLPLVKTWLGKDAWSIFLG